MPDGTEWSQKSRKKQGKIESARQTRRENYKPRNAFDVEALYCAEFIRALTAVTNKSGALRIGLTRDGGALAVGIYGDNEPYTEYVDDAAAVGEYFNGLADYFDGL